MRPVAGGETLRKLTARALMRGHRDALLSAAGEFQFGAGRPAGAETLLHTVQAVAAHRPSHAWVQLDVANAFPSVSRRAVLEAVEEFAPVLLPLAETFLRRTSSFLYLGADGQGEELHATLGVEQGDVLGPLLFAVGFRRPVETLRAALVVALSLALRHRVAMVAVMRKDIATLLDNCRSKADTLSKLKSDKRRIMMQRSKTFCETAHTPSPSPLCAFSRRRPRVESTYTGCADCRLLYMGQMS